MKRRRARLIAATNHPRRARDVTRLSACGGGDTGLDRTHRRRSLLQAQVLNLLADIREQTDLAYLFISHDLGVVRAVCSEILVMASCEVVERGKAEKILTKPSEAYTKAPARQRPAPGLGAESPTGAGWNVITPRGKRCARRTG